MKNNLILKLLAISAVIMAAVACSKTDEQKEEIVYTPSISYIVPATAQPGDVVQVFGKHFSTEENNNTVVFGSENAMVLAAEQSRLYVLVPTLQEGTCQIKVSVGGKQSDGIDFICKYEDERPLAIVKLSPDSGYSGEEVVITGVGFDPGATIVTFDGIESEIKSITTNIIKVTAPEHTKGNVNVVVWRGEKADTANFVYQQLIFTNNAPTEGYEGTEVTITGEGFSQTASENEVLIDTVVCPVKSASSTSLVVTMPDMKAGTYSFKVTVAGRSVSGGSFQYMTKTYVETVAGKHVQVHTDGVGLAAGFCHIQSIVNAGNGKYYVTQRGGKNKDAIRLIDTDGWKVSTFVNSSNAIWGSGAHPWHAEADHNGNLFIAVKGLGTVAKVTPDGTASTITFKNDTRNPKSNPMAVLIGKSGHLFVTNRTSAGSFVAEFDSDMSLIKVDTIKFSVQCMCWNSDSTKMFLGSNSSPYGIHELDLKTGKTNKIAGTGDKPTTAALYTEGNEGQPLTATIGAIESIRLADDGTLYFSDYTSYTVRKLSPAIGGDYSKGTVSFVAGTPLSVLGTTENQTKVLATQAKFAYPADIEILPDGSLLIADATADIVRRIYSE